MKLVIRWKLDGPTPAEKMERFRQGLRHTHELLGEEYLSLVQMNFEGEHEPDGSPWTPLARSTAEAKVTKGHRRGYHPILRVSGRLANIHYDADERRVIIGTNVRYAAIHQFGGMAGRGRRTKIPARPWLFGRDGSVPGRFEKALAAIVKRELDNALAD